MKIFGQIILILLSTLILLALAWQYTTIQAYTAIRRKEVVRHQTWMIRSFALTFAAVTLRLEIPLYMISGLKFIVAYRRVSWNCWILNLLVAEWIIRVQGVGLHSRKLA